MGGLCARYGLAQMTKNGETTDTRLLITHDSPHRGANVPLGLQYLIQMAGNASLFGYTIQSIFPAYNEAINLLSRPATQQMLIYRSTGTNSFVTNSFLDGDYRSMITFTPANPQPSYSFIATSLGNECGHALFQPSAQLINADADAFLFLVPIVSYRLHTIIQGNALPSTGSTNQIARFKLSSKFKLFGLITINKDVYDNTAYASGSQLAIDGVPGGTDPFVLPVPQINTGIFPIAGLFNIWGYANAQLSGDPTNFTFVPTASALDVSSISTASLNDKYVNGTNQNYPSTSQTFIAQESVTNASPALYNNVHIRFTARNSQWLYNEMEGLNNNLNCSNECFNPYYISGDNYFCSSSTIYSIPGLPRGATVKWSAAPASIVTINSPNSPQTTLTKLANGTITLTANITNVCNGSSVLQKQNITVGVPVLFSAGYTYNGSTNPLRYYDGTSSSYNPLCNSKSTVVNATFTGATSVTWSKVSSSATVAWTQNGNDLSFYLWNVGQTAVFKVDATNGCGTTSYTFGFQSVNCGGSGGGGCLKYNVTKINGTSVRVGQPNIPAPCRMMAQPGKDSSKTNDAIYLIKIYDMAGRLRLSQEFNHSKEAVVNTASLMSGVYIIEIWDGDTVERQKVPIIK